LGNERPFAEVGIIEATFVAGVTILRFVDDANEFLKRVEVFMVRASPVADCPAAASDVAIAAWQRLPFYASLPDWPPH
jgi:hypothetical protein